jgi:hypothetical protein
VIIARTREKIGSRTAPRPTEREIAYGAPLFLDQRSTRLRAGAEAGLDQLGASASLHGGELLNAGFTIGQVVQDYGDICQAITKLAMGARAIGGDISVTNLPGLGCVFTVELRRSLSAEMRQGSSSSPG